MRCKHCNKRLAFATLLKGHFLFCCDEHRELFVNSEAAEFLERLRSSFEDLAPKKPLPLKKPAADAEPVLAEGFAPSRAEGWEEPVPVEEQAISPTEDAGEATGAETTDQDPSESTVIRVQHTKCISRPLPRVKLLACWGATTQLVEEVQQKRQV